MKSIIIYYSQAGSTQKIAQAIYRGMSENIEQCDIVKIKDIQYKDLEKYDLIGLGSGVWGGNPAINVENFIKNMPSFKGKQGFYFCTHGIAPGNIMLNVIPVLKQKGLTVIGWNDWYGKVCIPYMPTPYYTEGHPDEIDMKEAEEWGRYLVQCSKRIANGELNLIPELPSGAEYFALYGENTPDPNNMPDEWAKARLGQIIKINAEKCTCCMLCVDNCPENNIELSGESPSLIKNECCKCLYCEKICPTGAVEFDFELINRMYQKYSKVEMRRWADSGIARGRFRMLIPMESVDWNNPWYKVTKHPRLEIP